MMAAGPDVRVRTSRFILYCRTIMVKTTVLPSLGVGVCILTENHVDCYDFSNPGKESITDSIFLGIVSAMNLLYFLSNSS